MHVLLAGFGVQGHRKVTVWMAAAYKAAGEHLGGVVTGLPYYAAEESVVLGTAGTGKSYP